MVDGDELEWIAGISDAEACFQTGMNGARRGNVVVLFQIGLVRYDVMKEVRRLVGEIVGEPVPEMHVRPATRTQREFYSLTVVAKQQVLRIAETVSPHLHGKRVEACVSVDILRRACGSQYVATERDRELCQLSRLIKKGDVSAKERATTTLALMPLATRPSPAWLAGMFDGDGSVGLLCQARDRATYYQPYVNISSSDSVAIGGLREAVSLTYGVTATARRKSRGGARATYSFNIATSDIERVLTDLRPHLRVKAAEADVMLDVFRGKTSREDAYAILRALKKADDPGALLEKLTAGDKVPDEPERVSRLSQHRRPTYSEMEQRGLWSSEQAREHLGGMGHAAWVKVTEGLVPDGTIGNKKYFSPASLRAHVTARLGAIVRTDARERVARAMEGWECNG